jgi:D-tyrosyl-tRNA(Tyr) deacylase
MKLLVQRVSYASVEVGGRVAGQIGAGLLVLVGCRAGDGEADADYLADKVTALRIFRDARERMNLSLLDTGGAMLVVSQFTLYADTRRGNRPGFDLAGPPAVAERLCDYFAERVRSKLGAERVATGEFGADMQVALCNDGPVTIELCSDHKYPKEDRLDRRKP